MVLVTFVNRRLVSGSILSVTRSVNLMDFLTSKVLLSVSFVLFMSISFGDLFMSISFGHLLEELVCDFVEFNEFVEAHFLPGKVFV